MVVNKTSCAGVDTAKAVGLIADDADTLKKASSLTISVIDIALNIFSFFPGFEAVKAGFGLLRGRLNDLKTIINATSLLGRGFEWADDKERSKILTKSWQKAASRISLTVAQVFETVGFVDKLSFKFFTQPSLSIAGKMPIFDLVKNGLYLVSSAFALWDAKLDMDKADRGIKDAAVMKRKWEKRALEFNPNLLKFDRLGYLNKYTEKKQAEEAKGDKKSAEKLAKYDEYVDYLTTDGTDDGHKEAVECFQEARAERLKDKFNAELKIAEEKADKVKTKALKTYIEAIENGHVKKVVDYQVSYHKVSIHNSKNSHTKAWISIAAEAGKIFMITVGTLVYGLSLIFPVLSQPAASLVMNSFGLVSNSFGLAKNLYRDVWYQSNMQKLKPFEAAAAA
jgi:hypothetical protein